MKKIFTIFLFVPMFTLFSMPVFGSVTVSGGGSEVNGTYEHLWDNNGRPAYSRTSGSLLLIFWTGSNWRLSDGSGNPYYSNYTNTSTPPDVGWQIAVESYAIPGVGPAPVMSGDVSSLLIGDGSSGNPYQIVSLNSLYWIAMNPAQWDKNFIQLTNIDASETSTWFGGEGWTPIGNFSTYFTGSYNGATFSINGLYINRPSVDIQSLFGVVFQGSVTNLGLTNVNITGKMNVGGIVGYLYNSSTMSNCYSTGVVSGESYVGGLCSNVHTNSTINNSLSSCIITASNQGAGGLVGRCDQSSAAINSSCFLGSVSGYEYAGGVAAFLYQSTVTNCYSAGTVTGTLYVGGLIGSYNSSTVNNSFWDVEASGRSSSAGGTGKTTAEMKTQSTFTDAGWDFEGETINGTNDDWDIDDPVEYNNGYPFLSWQEGTEIWMPVELVSFSIVTKGQEVELTWKTATEVNNAGFDIERRAIGNGQWTTIGFVQGSGNSNAPKEYSFIDSKLAAGTYSYRLKQIDRDGKFVYGNSVDVTVAMTASEYILGQNFPNPFNPNTTISFAMSSTEHVTITVYDPLGRAVATLYNSDAAAGQLYHLSFNGQHLSSGTYFYVLRSPSRYEAKKMSLMK